MKAIGSAGTEAAGANITRTMIKRADGKGYLDVLGDLADVDIGFIATGLANISRYGGQIPPAFGWYSVAQHSCMVSRMVPAEHARAAFCHDFTEAILGSDVMQPIKWMLPDYCALEDTIAERMAERFGFELPLHPCIKHADKRATWIEQRAIFKTQDEWLGSEPRFAGDPFIHRGLSRRGARAAFLTRARELDIK